VTGGCGGCEAYRGDDLVHVAEYLVLENDAEAGVELDAGFFVFGETFDD